MTITSKISLITDKSTFKAGQKSLLEIEQGLESIGKTADAVGEQFRATADGLVEVIKAEKELASAVDVANQSLSEQDKLAKSARTASRGGGGGGSEADLGQIGSGARTVGGAIGKLGGDVGAEIDVAVAALAEIPDVFEDIPKITKNISKMGENLAKSGGVIGKVAQVGGSVASVIPGVSAGFGSVLAVAAPVAIVLAAVAAAMTLLNRANKKAEENAKKAQAAIDARINTEVEIENLIASGKTEDAIKEALQLQEDAAIATEKAARLRSNADKKAEAEAKQRVPIIDSLMTTQAEATKDAAEKSAKAAEEGANEAVAAYNAAKNSLADIGIDISNTNLQMMEKEQELADTRKQARDSIASLEAQEADLIAKREQQLADQAQDRSIRDRREKEDYQEQAAKHSERLSEITQNGHDQIEKITKEAAKEEAKIRQKAFDDIQEIATSSMTEESQAVADFNEESLKAQQDYYTRLRQLRMDYENAEFDAILSNNIIAAMQAQRNYEQQRQEEKSAFEQQKAEREADMQARIQEIRTENAIRIQEIAANLQKEIDEHKHATEERIREEKRSIRERYDAELKANEEAEKQRDKRLKRQEEDDALRDERSLRAHEEALKQIEEKKKAEIATLNATFNAVEQGTTSTIRGIAAANEAAIKVTENAAISMINAVQNAVNNSSGGSTPGRQHGGRILANRMYRVNEVGTEGFISDRAPGKVIPLTDKRTQNMGNTMIFSPTISVAAGEFASPQDIVIAVENGIRQLYQTDNQVFADALAGV